jgi:aspartate aminotransferase
MRGPQDSVALMLAEYRKRRDFVIDRLRTIPGVTCTQPQGAFYAFPRIGSRNTAEFAEQLLEKAHVAVVPGEAFGTLHHIRISYATSMGELARGLDRIHKFMAGGSE